jgi:hypothetical protein
VDRSGEYSGIRAALAAAAIAIVAFGLTFVFAALYIR